MTGRGRLVVVGGGVGTWIGDDGGLLRSVDGNRLETVDTVDSDGDGGVSDREQGCRCGDAVETVRGRNRPDLSRRSDEARLESVARSPGDGGQRNES